MKPFAEQFYKSKAWEDCRGAYIAERMQRDGGMCERCGEQPGYIVHHKTKLTAFNISDPLVALNADNLEYVCHDCHNKIHALDMHEVKTACLFDENGQPIDVRGV